ncbi:MAG: hypothetical protein LBH98_09190 [Chitinispirillales bacterium]|jgi:hypothetical protein|nr:hypothetical protein [Chitinispirillales bacterium]
MKCKKNDGKMCFLRPVKRIIPFLCWWKEDIDKYKELSCAEERAFRRDGSEDAKNLAASNKKSEKGKETNKNYYHEYVVPLIEGDFLPEVGNKYESCHNELECLNTSIRDIKVNAANKLHKTKLEIEKRRQEIDRLIQVGGKTNQHLIEIEGKMIDKHIKECGEYLIECKTSAKKSINKAEVLLKNYNRYFDNEVVLRIKQANVYWKAFCVAYKKFSMNHEGLDNCGDMFKKKLQENNPAEGFKVEQYDDIMPPN